MLVFVIWEVVIEISGFVACLILTGNLETVEITEVWYLSGKSLSQDNQILSFREKLEIFL